MSYPIATRDPKQIKRDVRGAVLCVVAFLVTMYTVAIAVYLVAIFVEYPEIISLSMGSSMTEYYNKLSEAILDVTIKYSGLASILGMVCGLPWFFLIRGKKLFTSDLTHTNSKVKISTILIAFVLILGIQFAMTLISLFLGALLPQGDAGLSDTLNETTTSLASSFWGALYIVVLGPIIEEIVFRGAVMRKLEKYGANFALVVSSLIFALYHIILFQAVFAFFVGLILGYVAGRFSIKWSMLLHMLNNSLAVISVAIASHAFDMALNYVFFAAFVASIFIIIALRKYFVMQKKAGAPSEPRVYQRAFSSPWLIAYIVLCVLSGLLMIVGI